MGWIASLFLLVGLIVTGRKRWWGWGITILGELLWAVVGAHRGEADLVVICLVFAAVAGWNLYDWWRPQQVYPSWAERWGKCWLERMFAERWGRSGKAKVSEAVRQLYETPRLLFVNDDGEAVASTLPCPLKTEDGRNYTQRDASVADEIALWWPNPPREGDLIYNQGVRVGTFHGDYEAGEGYGYLSVVSLNDMPPELATHIRSGAKIY